MASLTADEIAIRIAIEDAVQAAGGGRPAAVALNTDETKISRLHNRSNERSAQASRVYLKAHEAVTLDRLAGSPIILSAMASCLGVSVVEKAEVNVAAEGMQQHTAEILHEMSEAIAAMSAGIKAMTPAKAQLIFDELGDVICRAKDAQNECMREIVKGASGLKAVS